MRSKKKGSSLLEQKIQFSDDHKEEILKIQNILADLKFLVLNQMLKRLVQKMSIFLSVKLK